MRRYSSLALITAIGALTLSACTPPMPDSLKVELAERSVQCGEGFVEAKVLSELVDVSDFWNSSMDVACEGSMGLTVIDDYPSADGLIISEEDLKGCKPYASVPLAADAAVFAFALGEIYEINLSPLMIAQIIDGSITNWADPEIQKVNPAIVIPDMSINLITTAPPGAIEAMGIWLSAEVGDSVSMKAFSPSTGSEVDALYELADGDIKLTSFAALQISAMNYANMILDISDPESIVLPDVLTIQTGIGQTRLTGEAPYLSFVYDPSIAAAPLPGQFDAIEPWGAIFPVQMQLCGEDNLQTRFVARFLLRLDSQGSISTGVFSPLLEQIRVASVAVVDDGLPEVEIPEELLKELQG